jgi:type I restriction enzyme M protein
MTASTASEGEIRRAIVDADLIDCMVALPGQLFYSHPDPRLRVAPRQRPQGDPRHARPSSGEVLMIDARDMGTHGRPHPPRAPRR